MKVAIVGAHGTGKSTLAELLSQRLGYNLIPDVVAQAYEKGFVINEQTPPETQFWILAKQLELERNTPTPWIADKSLYDNIVYGDFSIKDKEVLNVIRKIVFANASYDLLFYLPLEFPLPQGVLRSLNVEFQKSIDEAYQRFLGTAKIPYVVLSGSLEGRADKAVEVVEDCAKKKNG